MFDKNKFAQIIKNIKDTYNSQEEFSKKSEIGRTYLSQYMNMKIDKPPKPIILQKLANASHGITTYEELMIICGHISENNIDSHLLGMLGLTEQDMIDFANSLDAIQLSEHEKLIFADIIEEIRNAMTHNQKAFHLDILKYAQKEPIDSQKRIGLALQLFMTYMERVRDFSSVALNNKPNSKSPNNSKPNENASSQYYMCPVYGQISAGIPNWAEECIEGRLPIDPVLFDIINPEEHFFLRINGESMNKVIHNGAYALIHKQDMVENGEIAVVLVNGYEATLKKFTRHGDVIVLEPMSDDNTFQTQIYNKDTPIQILGKYIGKFEMNK